MVIDAGSIAGLIASVKAASEITKGMVGVRDTVLLQDKVIELNGIILTAQSHALTTQSDQFSLLERVRELEEEVAHVKAWEAEKQRYQLTDVGNGSFAYVLKEETGSSDPPHNICANCYEDGHRSILQNETTNGGRRPVMYCPRCDTTLWPSGGGPDRHKGNPPRRGGAFGR